METQKDNAAQQLRMALTAYAVELVNETPILSRYTDVFPRSDGLGGLPEIERDKAWRKNLKYPSNATDLDSCITALTQFRDAPTLWDNLRGELLKSGNDWLAKELQYRRERRNANIENLLSEARKLAPEMPTDYEILSAMSAPDEDKQTEPKYDIAAVMQGVKDGTLEPPPTLPREATGGRTGSLDFRAWECAATKFDNDTAGDIEYIWEVIAGRLVSAYADHHDRELKAQTSAGLQAAIDAKEESTKAKVAAEGALAGVSFLVHDRMEKQASNRKRGKESREKTVCDDAERRRAKCDIQTALRRVHERVAKQGQQVLAACRWTCLHFCPLTDAKKNAPTYLPLTKADGKPVKPETLARYYRKEHKAKRDKK